MNGAEILVGTLAAAGVSRIYSLSGNQIMPIYDACIDAGIAIVHTRHEAAAVFMADAHARISGEAGVCLVTAAPGAANAMGALYSALQSESPVLLLTGDSPLSQDRQGAFQELDQIAMSSPLTRLSLRAQSTAGLGSLVARALRCALSGRPGPVHLALPVDVLQAEADEDRDFSALDFSPQPQPLEQAALAELADSIAAAQAPLILCGPAMNTTGCADSVPRLARALDAPVVVMESPRGLKDPSLGDFRTAIEHSDLLVCLGKSVDFTLGFGRNIGLAQSARWIVIDPDPVEQQRAERNLGDTLAASYHGAAQDVAGQLLALERGDSRRTAWCTQVQTLLRARTPASANARQRNSAGLIDSADLCAAVQVRIDALGGDVVVISDGGEFGQWSQAGVEGQCRIINGPSGAIGGGLCFALAAKKARPGSTVIALMGDGTVGFHLAEFETAVRENTPFVVVIGNDQRWNAEHLIQLRQYGAERLVGCELSAARYDLAVQALGGHGEFVTDYAELDAALQRAIDSNVVSCVNVRIEGLPAPEGSARPD